MGHRRPRRRSDAAGDAQWYKDAVIYELHVRSFQDSSGDGIGDFRGLTARLPYLQDLGVTALWLLPFYPSPLRDDGYDIADYTGVHPDYGSLDDFRRFLDEAHRLSLRVITELVVNHTSDQHAWFQRARAAPPGSTEREFYVWSDSPERYGEARIIFQDFERSNWTWDPVAQAYYWHRFYSHQPDLNYDNPTVFDSILRVLDHWFGLGVDGMRLDAVPYLVEREGTSSENLGQTHAVVKRLRAHVDRTFSGRVFIAEANQWPEDAAAYFGDGDESHMIFHFPLMPRLFMALRQEDRLPIVDILAQTPAPPPGGQWALFLRNHDELTLEMVTDEERVYMYHVYATETHARLNLGIRRRLAPLLGNHRRRIELMNALLFSLQGTPVLYYGDEIGMGDNVYLGDRNGVRTPMQWSGDRNAGFSDAPAQRLFLPLIVDDEYHYQSVHVAQQLGNPHSLLWWMKRLIALRKRYQAFGRGDLVHVECPNTRVLAFVRRWGAQQVLVVANLSRFVQHAVLDLHELRGKVPLEVFGRTPFPAVGDDPYALTLGPHGFLWFELTDPDAGRGASVPPRLDVEEGWEETFGARGRGDLENILPAYIERCTAWHLGGRTVLSVRIESAVPLGEGEGRRWLCVLRVSFTAGEPEWYLLPLGCRRASGRARGASRIVARLVLRRAPRERYELYDAATDPGLAAALLHELRKDVRSSGEKTFDIALGDVAALGGHEEMPGTLRRTRNGSNPVFAIGNRAVLKLFRRIEAGPNPEIEMRSHLQRVGFAHTPPLLAAFRMRLHDRADGHVWLGMLQQYVPNEGEAWFHAVRAARRCLVRAARERAVPGPVESLVSFSPWESLADPVVGKLTASYARTVERLAGRTADLHKALATVTGDAGFTVERPTTLGRRAAYQRMRTLAVSVLDTLRTRVPALDPALREPAEALLDRRADVLTVFHRLVEGAFTSPRIRCHGNLHLGQVLHARDELVIIDFDGEPGRPLYERRLNRSPLQDVATMVRSFHYAAHAAWKALQETWRDGGADDVTRLRWMRAWQVRMGAVFIDAYSRSVAESDLLPADATEARVLFQTYLVERALYELGFELNHRGAWLTAPLVDLPLLLTPLPSSVGGVGTAPEVTRAGRP